MAKDSLHEGASGPTMNGLTRLGSGRSRMEDIVVSVYLVRGVGVLVCSFLSNEWDGVGAYSCRKEKRRESGVAAHEEDANLDSSAIEVVYHDASARVACTCSGMLVVE